MNRVLLLSALVSAVLAEHVSFNGYKVYTVTPKGEHEMALLKELEKNEIHFDFWSSLRMVNRSVDIMVAPVAQRDFIYFLKKNDFIYELKISDVEQAFEIERFSQKIAPRTMNGRISFSKYERYANIESYVRQVAKDHPDFATVMDLGQTYEGRNLVMLKISTGGSGKPAILIDSGIHAREWVAPPVSLYAIQQLVENPSNRDLIENIDWYIVPVLNPDGYEYSHTGSRLWRKTRSPAEVCFGVDGNRNFDFHWMEKGASSYECSETYAGPKAFSEPETSALRDFMLANKDAIKLYLTIHSYGNYILYPWGYTSELPEDEPELYDLGKMVEKAITSYRGTTYVIGSSTNVLYAAAGGSDDYAKGVAGIQLSYTLELPGGRWGFDPPASEIKPIVEETWLGIKAYHNYIERKFV